MRQHLVSLALLAVCVATSVAQDKFANKTRPCGPQVFAKLDSCCTMPKLLPFETFKTCFGREVANVEVEKSAFKGSVRKTRATDGKKSRSGELALKPGRRSFGPKNGPMCLIECVLRTEKLLKTDNEVDVDAVTKRFVESAGEAWKTQVEAQVKTCWDELNKVDFSKMPPPPPGLTTVCKPKGAMLMSCIRRGLILNCPSASKKTEDQSCPAKLANLQKCDPFSIPPPRGAAARASGQKGKSKIGKGSKGKNTQN